MKLFLHWLRWDLRRFRWPLLAWTALVTAFFSLVGWLNANMPSLDVIWFKSVEPFAAVLLTIELCLLPLLMGSDPAGGVQAFWKTRPPSGFSVAGAKLTLAGLFFLVLPLLCWCVTMQFCGLPVHQPGRWDNASWYEFIWWVEAMSISAVALAAAVARGTGSVLLRLLAGVAISIGALTILTALLRAWAAGNHTVSPFNPFDLRGASFPTPRLWLGTTAIVFLLLRSRRTPHLSAGMVSLLMPVGLIVAEIVIPKPLRREPGVDDLPSLESALVSKIEISPQRLRSGFDYANRYVGGRSREVMVALHLRLVITGLPENCMAYGRWSHAKLNAPDGRTVETAMPGRHYEAVDEPWGEGILPRSLPTVGLVFRASDLAPFSQLPCKLEGVLELIVAQKHEGILPLQPGASLRTRGDCMIRLSRLDITEQEVTTVPVIEATLAGWDRGWLRLQRILPDGVPAEMAVSPGGMSWRRGFFLQQDRGDIRTPTGLMSQQIGYARFARDIQRGDLTEWSMSRSWYESMGRSEIPVSVQDIIIPRQFGDERTAESLLAPMNISESADPAEAVRTVRIALITAQERRNTSDALEAEVQRILSGVQRKHWAALLDYAEPAPAESTEDLRPYDPPLCRRLAELTLPEDIATLRARRLLFGRMKFALAEKGMISKSEAALKGRESDTDEALAAAWSRGDEDALAVLYEAARRGLPWTVAAIQEVLALMPGILGAGAVCNFMSSLSDCPAAPIAGIPWLRNNAARLVWDAAAKRWVLPQNP